MADSAGLVLDDWQKWVLRGALGERANGTWAAFECGLIVPRQSGKNAILEAFELACLVLFGDELIVHTAHRADTTLEHFRRMKVYAEEFEDFGRLVHRVSNKNGDEAIELKGNRRVRFVSRARNPGRGFSGSKVIFDEAAYGLDASVLGAVVPTMATKPMAQVWYTSSAPKAESQVLHSVLRRGRDGGDEDDRLFYAEWSNSADVDPADVNAWYRANPGLGIRISEEYVRAEHRLMADVPAEFARERLGIPEEPAGSADGPIPLDRWELLADGDSMAVDGSVRLALDVSPDRKMATFGIAGRRSDGLGHVAVRDRRPGTDWVVARGKELAEGHGCSVIIGKGSPAASFIDELERADVSVDVMPVNDYAEACGRFVDATTGEQPSLRHRGDPNLRVALSSVHAKPAGDGGMVWSRRSTSVDITPLTTVTMAWGRVDDVSDSYGWNFY